MSVKPKIEVGEPFYRQTALCVPTKFNFPDGAVEEIVLNWHFDTEADEIERQLKLIWKDKWDKRKRAKSQPSVEAKEKLKGLKIHKIHGFDDEE